MSDHFLDNVKDAMKIVALKYLSATHNIVLVFDKSSNHCAFSEDSKCLEDECVTWG